MSLPNMNDSHNGFGIGSESDVAALSKALETGYTIGAGRTGGATLRVESLEASLKVTTFSANHIKFWKKIPKSPAYSTVEEYNQLTDYGGNASPFVAEGELGQNSDSSYVRKQVLVKYMQTVRSVSHVATMTHPAHGDLIALENQNGILWLLQQIENYLFTGNASLAFNGVGHQFDGLDSLIDPTATIDMAGTYLEPVDIESGARIIADNFGFATDIFMGQQQASDIVKTFYPQQRVLMPAMVNGTLGQSVKNIETQAGTVELNSNVFIKPTPSPRASASSTNAPATPASIAGAANTGVTTAAFNKDGISTGVTTYYSYVVTAANRFGESAPTAVMGAAVAMTATNKSNGNSIALTITNASSIGAFAPEYYKIYRSVVSAVNAVPASLTSYFLIAQVPAGSQTASATTVVGDLNTILPNTSTAYLLELTPSVLTFRQLLPMVKMDLAVLGPAYRWLIMMYGTPLLAAPRKALRYINVNGVTIPSTTNPLG